MKIAKLIGKLVVALAAIAGAVYVIATYGNQIVEWCKKVLASLPCCKDSCCCNGECECECECDEECCCEECCCEEAAEEAVEEAAEEPVAEAAAEEAANDSDFES